MSDRMTKIGVYYDGNYFLHVSNYYNYDHARKRRLSVTGLHEFVRQEVAKAEGTNPDLCRIVDAHYFRGRLSAQEAYQRGQVIYWDRVFDDILMSAGVSTHYNLQKSQNGRREDRGMDISLALEAYDQAIHRKLDLVVLIAGDGGYVPLIRKLNALGTRVMILSWDFEFTSDNGSTMITRSSQDLLEEASYPVPMHEIINGRIKQPKELVDGIFVAGGTNTDRRQNHPDFKADDGEAGVPAPNKDIEFEQPEQGEIGEMMISSVLSLKNGYGFIKYPPNNLFFHYTTVKNIDFNDLLVDDQVEFCLAHNSDGQLIATDVSLLEEEE
ncbi:cold-shock protein [Lewinellaceae bacterium SD302]|nr:cold-shock protein [Lewinellaceae bacterium SD302]